MRKRVGKRKFQAWIKNVYINIYHYKTTQASLTKKTVKNAVENAD